jgi:hypothetical protein
LFVTQEKFSRVRGHVALEHISGVQVSQELDDFILRGSVIAKARADNLPQGFDGALAIHQPDHTIRRW